MKELSIEEKAARYDRSLERARDVHTYYCDDREQLRKIEHIFPELAESEDERIRKALIEGFKVMKDGSYGECTFSNYNIPVTAIIAWLEKQGEKHIYRELSNLLNRVICRFINDPNIPYSERDEVSKKIIPYIEQLEKQGEQKPADKVEPFDKYKGLTDFERTLADICIGWIGEEPGWKQYIKDNADVLLKIAIKKFNSVQDVPFKQKPAWSEEDINMFGSILSTLGVCANNPQIPADIRSIHKKEESWFNELYHRVQPKQEWSEEDEKKIDGLISIVEEWYNNQSEEEKEYYGDCGYINWLKSLKPQSQWKPSDEQIDALKRAIAKERENPDTKQFARHLESLFNELIRL